MEKQVITQKNPEIKQDVLSIRIPDLWHIAGDLPKPSQKLVLETWHLCHSLLEHIKKNS